MEQGCSIPILNFMNSNTHALSVTLGILMLFVTVSCSRSTEDGKPSSGEKLKPVPVPVSAPPVSPSGEADNTTGDSVESAVTSAPKLSKEADNTTGNSTPTPPVSPALPSDERKWQEAYNKGVELHNQDKFTEASYYFSNALGSSPGNYTVIEGYAKTMFSLAQKDASVLPIIESFLTNQIPFVKVDEVEKVLNLLKDVSGKIKIAAQSEQLDPEQAENPHPELLDKIKMGDYSLSQMSPPELAEQLVKLSDLQDSVSEQDIETAKKIADLIKETQGLLNFDTLKDWLELRKKSVEDNTRTSVSIAEYQLQECEQIVREMIALRLPNKNGEIEKEILALRDLVKGLAEKKSSEKSSELWKESKEKIDRILLDPKAGEGENEARMQMFLKKAAILQNVTPFLSGEALEKAVAERNIIKNLAEEANNAQSKRYNNWAIREIQTCLGKCRGGVGFFINGSEGRETISKALIEHIGPIDRRFLTAEVSRAYDEVLNKYMAPNQLNPVKDEKSIEQEDNILYTLKQMYEKPKRKLSQF
jgi:hypothetical protein